MSVQNVNGLADIVKQTMAALVEASTAAGEMQTTAGSVVSKVATVKALTEDLKAADAALGAAIGQMSNGAPPGPLPDTVPSEQSTPTSLPPAPTLVPFDIHTRRDRP